MIHDLHSGNVIAAPSTKITARKVLVLNQPILAIRVNAETVLRFFLKIQGYRQV
jgi:hypothetical protein